MVMVLIVVSVAMSSIAQLLLKFGMDSASVRHAIAEEGLWPAAFTIGTNPLVLSGLAIYFLGAVVWLFVLSRIQLSYAYPFVALGFVFTAILARLFLDESFTAPKIIGTLLIISGVLVLARSIALSQ